MSDTEHSKGTLVPTGKTVSEFMHGVGVMPKHFENVQEWFDDFSYRTHVVHKLMVYEVNTQALNPDDDIMIASERDDGTIEFEVKFYNGGCSFSEAIDCSLDQMELNQ